MDCRDDSDSITAWLAPGPGPGPGRCRPWGPAEAPVTAPALALAAAFVGFALATTSLSFSFDPMSRAAGDACTGRINALWITVRLSPRTPPPPLPPPQMCPPYPGKLIHSWGGT